MTQLRKQASIHGGNELHPGMRAQMLAKNGGRNPWATRSQAKAFSVATGADRKSKSPSKAARQKYQSATSKIPSRVQRPQTAKAQHNPAGQIKNKLTVGTHHNSISNQFFKDPTSRNPQLNQYQINSSTQVLSQALSRKSV